MLTLVVGLGLGLGLVAITASDMANTGACRAGDEV